MWRHYVYVHRKATTGEPFYIGKGSRPDRAHSTDRRNPIWHRIVAKHGIIVEIAACCIDDRAAQDLERSFVAEIGRRDLGTGPLVNLTDGGDGHVGLVISAEVRQKRSISASRPRSQAWIESIRLARKNGGNGGVVKHGDKLPASWRANIAATKHGADNPMFGRTGERHHLSRKVVDEATGDTFPSVTAAAAHLGIRMQTLHNMLTGFRPNSTTLRLAA